LEPLVCQRLAQQTRLTNGSLMRFFHQGPPPARWPHSDRL